MMEATLDNVLKLASQLTETEQEVLIERLQAAKQAHKSPNLELPVIDLGPWPETLSLRREDWYDDDGR